MARLVNNWLSAAIQGRPNRRSDTYARVNRQTGKVSIVQVLNPYRGPGTERQSANRRRFGEVSSAIIRWMQRGKATDSIEFLKALNEYRQQHEVGNFLGWCMKKVPDTRPGHSGLEHRAIVREWVTIDEGYAMRD